MNMMQVASRVALALVSAIMVPGTVCADSNTRKMSPYVRQAALAARSAATRSDGSADASRIVAFVQADSRQADSLFAVTDSRVYDRQGDIYIVSVPTTVLETLAASQHVRRIEASAPCTLTMDTTTVITGAAKAHDGYGLPQAYTGSGVVMGIVDVGFDLTCPNFYDTDMDTYRISAFWDQLDSDTAGSALAVGRDYTGYEAVKAKGRSTDGEIQTHGTHTLGIAAGGGAGSAYKGMAYGTDICAVSNAITSDIALINPADLYLYTSAVDALAFKYIFDYADNREMPCVASFSEGYHLGYTADDSLFAEYLASLTGEGHIIVASAGNESYYLRYLPKAADEDSAGTFVCASSVAAVMYVSADGPVDIGFTCYGAETESCAIASRECVADSSMMFVLPFPASGLSYTVNVLRYPSAFIPTDTIYEVYVSGTVPLGSDDATPADDGTCPMALTLAGEGVTAALWSGDNARFINALADERWSGAVEGYNVLAPACFPGVIAVGATIHRTGYTSSEGVYIEDSQEGRTDGVRAVYSSMGPAYGDRIKPDVMAPGTNVISSYSSWYLAANTDTTYDYMNVALYDYDGRTYAWTSNKGTSMSAPVVAGAIALWLEACPTLTPDDVMETIAATSRQPEDELLYPNNEYGYGEIDAHAGLMRLLGMADIDGVSVRQAEGVAVWYADGCLHIRLDRDADGPLYVRMYSLSGWLALDTRIPSCAGTDISLPMPALQSGVYAVQLAGCRDGSALVRVQ